jgi:hypothetical protein
MDRNPHENRLLARLDRPRMPLPAWRRPTRFTDDPRHLLPRPPVAATVFQPRKEPTMPTVTARALKVTAVLPVEQLALLVVPEGNPRWLLTVRIGEVDYQVDLNAKSARRSIAQAKTLGPDCAAIVQGKLIGDQITEAGLVVQERKRAVEPAEAA